MELKELLPIGSVVLLNNAYKKIVIIGVMQIKHTDDGQNIVYDYMGVPYPEGYMGQETGLLFNHTSIQEIIFKGFVNKERDDFIKIMEKIVEKTEETLMKE